MGFEEEQADPRRLPGVEVGRRWKAMLPRIPLGTLPTFIAYAVNSGKTGRKLPSTWSIFLQPLLHQTLIRPETDDHAL